MTSDIFIRKSGSASGLQWSMIKLPKEGEYQCGDLHLIKKFRDKVLVAVIDGLGHGESAAHASQRAKYLLETFSNESLINVINHCHKNLRNTRGVVMSLALVDSWERTLTWSGVGNVKGVLLPGDGENGSTPESIILKNGIVGYNLPSLKASIIPISIGDILIFSTDGVKAEYLDEIKAENSPEEIAEQIATNYFKRSDDALILVARFMGEETDVPTE